MATDLRDFYMTFSGIPDEPLAVNTTLDNARRNARTFAANGGRPIRIVRYTYAEEVETIEPE